MAKRKTTLFVPLTKAHRPPIDHYRREARDRVTRSPAPAGGVFQVRENEPVVADVGGVEPDAVRGGEIPMRHAHNAKAPYERASVSSRQFGQESRWSSQWHGAANGLWTAGVRAYLSLESASLALDRRAVAAVRAEGIGVIASVLLAYWYPEIMTLDFTDEEQLAAELKRAISNGASH